MEKVISNIKEVLFRAYDGYTYIYADLKAGSPSEVDTISGSVVKAAKRLGMSAPYHEFVVELVHAFEDKSNEDKSKKEIDPIR